MKYTNADLEQAIQERDKLETAYLAAIGTGQSFEFQDGNSRRSTTNYSITVLNRELEKARRRVQIIQAYLNNEPSGMACNVGVRF